MMVTFSKLPLVGLVVMLCATSPVHAAQTNFAERLKLNPTTLANAAQKPTENTLLAQTWYPKTTIASELKEVALKLLLIDAAFALVIWYQPNYSRMMLSHLSCLAFYAAGLAKGKAIGVNKIYRQLTRKFGKDWWSWGLKKAKPAPVVSVK